MNKLMRKIIFLLLSNAFNRKQMNSMEYSPSPITQNEEHYITSSTFKSCDDLLRSVWAFCYATGWYSLHYKKKLISTRLLYTLYKDVYFYLYIYTL